jgi:hypothetical protein
MQQWHNGPRPERAPLLRSKRAFNETVKQTFGLQVAKRAVEFSIGLLEMSVTTLWRSRTPLKRKKKLIAA